MIKYRLILRGKAKDVFKTLKLLAEIEKEVAEEKILFSTAKLQVSVSSLSMRKN